MNLDKSVNNTDDIEPPTSVIDDRQIEPISVPYRPNPSWEGLELSPRIDQLFEALAKAQSQIDSAPKSGLNQFLGNKYSTLDDVRRACAKALSENKIGWTQVPFNTGERLGVITLFVYQEQWMRSTLGVDVPETLMTSNRKGHQIKTYPRSDPQQLARLITYLRRISLAAMAGVTSTEEDLDGSPPPDQDAPTEPVPRPQVEQLIDKAQLHTLLKLMEDASVKQNQITTAYNIEAIAQLPARLFESCKGRLESTLEAKAKLKPDDA
jgi:hypothetical protein